MRIRNPILFDCRRPRGISDHVALCGQTRTGKAVVALAGEPGRRTSLPAAERVPDDSGGRCRGVQPPKAGPSSEGVRANDRTDQHVQHTQRHIGWTPSPPADRRRRPRRQLHVAATPPRQLSGAARAQARCRRTVAGDRGPSAAAAAAEQQPLLHECGLAAHVKRDHVQLSDTAAAAVHFRDQLPGAHQRPTVQPGGRFVVSHPHCGAFFASRPGPAVAVGLLGNEFQ